MADFTKKITITANTKEAESALARLEVEMKGFGETIERFSGHFENVSRASENLMGKLERLGLASVFAEGGAIGLANKIADVGFELGETAIKTGLTTAQLQYWQYVAKQSNVDAETLTHAFARLNTNIGMANKPTSEQAQALRFLGVSAKDSNGHIKSSNELFLEVMKALGKVHDQTKRNLAAQILLSRSYIDLLPIMKAISSGSKENTEDFKEYGYVMSEQAIKQSEEFHRASINLQTSLMGLADSVGTALMPAILPLITAMSKYVSKNREAISIDISNFIKETGRAFRGAWLTALPFLRVLKDIVKEMGGMKTVILVVAGYIAADLLVSFVALGVQISIATFAMLRFIFAGRSENFVTLTGLVLKLREAFVGLNAVMLLNPIAVMFTGIAAAVMLVVVALMKLKSLFGSIKASFNSHTGIYSSDFWKKLVVQNGNPSSTAQLPASFNTSSQLMTASPLQRSTPIVPRNAAATQGNKQVHLNVHMRIDADGKPTIQSVLSSDPLTFTSALGLLR